MKKILKLAAVLLSLSAMGQSIFTVKKPRRNLDSDIEQEKLMNLLNDTNSEEREFKKDEIAEQAIQYLKSINADKNLVRLLQQKCEKSSELKPETPGI